MQRSEELTFDEKDKPLRDEVNYLGKTLGETIRDLAGEEVLEDVEWIRQKCIQLRESFSEEDEQELRSFIEERSTDRLFEILKAFSLYFQLINLAEDNHRIRRNREYERNDEHEQQHSLPWLVKQLKDREVSAERVQEILNDLEICPVFTAHPTEIKRKTVIDKLEFIANQLRYLDNASPTPFEEEVSELRIKTSVNSLWQTRFRQESRVRVMEEVESILNYFDRTLLEETPKLYRRLERALNSAYPDHDFDIPMFLKFGSWAGGDRDGNPYVKPDTTLRTLKRHKEIVLKAYKDKVGLLIQQLSHSTVVAEFPDAFLESLEEDKQEYPDLTEELKNWESTELFRRKCAYMYHRLEETIDALRDFPEEKEQKGYLTSEEFLNDLQLIDDALQHQRDEANRCETLQDLIWMVKIFGFYTARLDIRDHRDRVRDTASELLRKAGVIEDELEDLDEEEQQEILSEEIGNPRPLYSDTLSITDRAEDVIGTFSMIADGQDYIDRDCIHYYILSMTHEPSDLLCCVLLAREAGLIELEDGKIVSSRIRFVPLVETIYDLEDVRSFLDQLYSLEIYDELLEVTNRFQEIMIGYSDSCKGGGILSSSWLLYQSQKRIARICDEHNVEFRIFHGRGGTIARGGGPTYRAILAQPDEAKNGRIKTTEQGEVIFFRYFNKHLAQREFQQLTSAMIMSRVQEAYEPTDQLEVMDQLANHSKENYQSLIYENEDLFQYFQNATPIQELEWIHAGSRPKSRSDTNNIEDLRAITWVFSWMQNRHLIPGWYGLGSSLEEGIETGLITLDELSQLYAEWPYFRSIINNIQMSMSKTDMNIAEMYADELVEDEDVKQIFHHIRDEYERTRDLILSITGQEKLLEHNYVLRRSIMLRNPYVDPLSYIQVHLLENIREQEGSVDEDLIEAFTLSVNGIAAGLKNTG